MTTYSSPPQSDSGYAFRFPRLRRLGWGVVTVLSVAVALFSWRFLVVSPETLYPNVTSEAGPEIHLLTLLREHWLRFASHFVFGPLALMVGPFQFVSSWRRLWPRLHRGLGYAYAGSIAISGTGGLLLSFGSFGGLTTHVGFGFLAVLWLSFTALAVWHARHRRFERHRQWMVRSFALTFGAVTLRLWLPFFMVQGVSFEAAYQTVAWLAWVPNLLLAEWLFVASRSSRHAA